MKAYPPLPRRMWNLRPWRRSPLMRASYRVEQAVRVFLAASLVFAAPLAIGIGMTTYTAIERHAASVTAGAERVDAVLDSGPEAVGRQATDPVEASVHWVFEGRQHSAAVAVPEAAVKGDHVMILVRPNGDLTPAVDTPADAVSNGIGAAVAVLVAAVVATAGVSWGLRRVLDGRRCRAWAAEWATLADERRWNHM